MQEKGSPGHLAAVDAGLLKAVGRDAQAAAWWTEKPREHRCGHLNEPRRSRMPALWPGRRRPHRCTAPDGCQAGPGHPEAPSQMAICLHGIALLHEEGA